MIFPYLLFCKHTLAIEIKLVDASQKRCSFLTSVRGLAKPLSGSSWARSRLCRKLCPVRQLQLLHPCIFERRPVQLEPFEDIIRKWTVCRVTGNLTKNAAAATPTPTPTAVAIWEQHSFQDIRTILYIHDEPLRSSDSLLR